MKINNKFLEFFILCVVSGCFLLGFFLLKEPEQNRFDEEEIKASLTYFHFIGMLLYFQNSNLCDYVVVNLQWLYNNLAEVMHISSENVTFDDTKF